LELENDLFRVFSTRSVFSGEQKMRRLNYFGLLENDNTWYFTVKGTVPSGQIGSA
jgi:hypothetical protein